MKWIESNDRRPETEGAYHTQDSSGGKDVTDYFDGSWHSETGHPVMLWLDEWDEWVRVPQDFYPAIKINDCSKDVIVYTRYDKIYIGFYDKKSGKWWEAEDDEHKIDYVTHWKELPEKPANEQGGVSTQKQ